MGAQKRNIVADSAYYACTKGNGQVERSSRYLKAWIVYSARAASAPSTTFRKTHPRMLKTTKPARIAIKARGKIRFIDAADLIAVEAKGNYVLLSHSSGSDTLRESISTIEEKLSLFGFVRIHRSVLVNAASVEEMFPRPTGEYVIRVQGGQEFIVTRTYKKNIQLLAQLWIGMGGFRTD